MLAAESPNYPYETLPLNLPISYIYYISWKESSVCGELFYDNNKNNDITV